MIKMKNPEFVLRGAAFYNSSRNVRCAYRDFYEPDYRLNFIGFRVVLTQSPRGNRGRAKSQNENPKP